MANKWVYMFSEGDMTMRNLLGGKGANLAEMTSIGLPVPQGFTITTEACTQYYEDGRKINDEIMAQAMEGVKKIVQHENSIFAICNPTMLQTIKSWIAMAAAVPQAGYAPERPAAGAGGYLHQCDLPV